MGLEVKGKRLGVMDPMLLFCRTRGEHDPSLARQNKLTAISPGYDIAWFNSPTRSLGDAQITAEYIAYNIKALAAKSKTGKVFVVSHSQGGINVQWALAFFPSTRQYISGFSSLAGDFKGEFIHLSWCR